MIYYSSSLMKYDISYKPKFQTLSLDTSIASDLLTCQGSEVLIIINH